MTKKIKKEFLVIGSNNFWYSLEDSFQDALDTAKEIKKDHTGFGDPESGHYPDKPETLYIYEAKELKEI